MECIRLWRAWGGEVETVSVLVAIGLNREGYRKVLGVAEGCREDQESWREFFRCLKRRGLERIRPLISDKSHDLLTALNECYPSSQWQRCVVHFYRRVLLKE